MKIDLDKIDRSKFIIKEKDGLFLVNPIYSYIDWKEEERIFRSSIWDKEGNLVSAGFKKFFNYGERNITPEVNTDCKFLEKLDGSLLVVSKYKGKMIYRTRGTFDVYFFDNSDEIDFLRKKYKIDEYFEDKLMDEQNEGSSQFSLLFEWLSPKNQIVIKYNEPELYLIGCINHIDYRYISQKWLDYKAKQLGVKRPERYEFKDYEDLINVKDWVNKEGVCMYYNNDQDIVKIKSLDYLKKHSFKSSMTWENICEQYLSWKDKQPGSMDSPREFWYFIERIFDYETMKYCKEQFGERLMKCYVDCCNQIVLADNYYFLYKDLERKEYAIKLQDMYKDFPFIISFAFNLLTHQQIPIKLRRKFYIEYID